MDADGAPPARKAEYRAIGIFALFIASLIAGRFAMRALVLEGTHYLNTFDRDRRCILRVFYIAAVGLLGAIATIVWLIGFGPNEGRWTEQSRAAVPMISLPLCWSVMP